LTELHEKYGKSGLSILAFPCNQFGGQEPGTNKEIKEFVKKYDVKFDLFDKCKVNGGDTHPLFRFLKANTTSTFGSFVKWNFTKFLVDRSGRPIERYGPPTEPARMVADIERLLKAGAAATAGAAPTA